VRLAQAPAALSVDAKRYQEGSVIAVWINSYCDQAGQWAGVVAWLSPHLSILIGEPPGTCSSARRTGSQCERCSSELQSRQLPTGERALGCDCVTVIFAAPIKEEQIVSSWPGWRRLRSQISARIAQQENN
jgi:hypothetical protein